MLNKKELWEKSQEIARLLHDYEARAEKAKTDRKNKVKQLLDAVSAKQFLLSLTHIVEDESGKEPYEQLGKIVHEMPSDNFPYFNTLIRFQYAILNP
jgi:predicted nucleic acid-binding protein